MKTLDKAYKYSDICLVPNYSEVYSRSGCDTFCELGGKNFKLPIMPANMKSVINMRLAKWMSQNDYFYIMHRFDNHLADDVGLANSEDWKTISFSIRVDFLTIDIAHGHCSRMKMMIEHIKKWLPNTKIIAGNVATPSAVRDLASWGADIVKVGIGQGSPCTTKDKTGFTMPMFSCTTWCSNVFKDENSEKPIPIIADGGIKCNGDIAKAMVAGASMVMAGGLFAACTDSPAVSSTVNDIPHKAYFGSASAENKGHNNNIEGKLTNIVSNGMTYESKLNEIKQDIQSAVSYSGGDDLSSLKNIDYFQT